MDKKFQKGANKMQEQEIKFNSNGTELAGTLTFPSTSGTFPGVLLIPGSGKVDRDENHKKMKINAFFEISHYLAQNGIASLRYDKRGVGQSGGNYYTTGFYEGVQDALAAIEYLKHQENIQPKNIFILGHSEGSIIATRLAGIGTEVAGIILLSGTAQSGEAVLKWQATQKRIKRF
ncbi:MAG: alpha/beta hydrolase [Candidatus Lokiarchaeota archaeon]